MPLNAGNWWFYFNRNGNIATCKEPDCTYTKELNASGSTFILSSHLKNNHLNLYEQRQKFVEKENSKKNKLPKVNTLKRSFAASSAGQNESDDQSSEITPVESNSTLMEGLKFTKKGFILNLKNRIIKNLCLGHWDRDGIFTKEANKLAMEWLSTSILPFSTVDSEGFIRFCHYLQPKYKPPKRKHFSQYELPESYERIKVLSPILFLIYNIIRKQ